MAYFGVFHENQRTAREQMVLNGISQANIFYYNNDMPTANTLSRLLTAVQSGDTLFIDTLDALGDGPKEAKQMINILKDLKVSINLRAPNCSYGHDNDVFMRVATAITETMNISDKCGIEASNCVNDYSNLSASRISTAELNALLLI